MMKNVTQIVEHARTKWHERKKKAEDWRHMTVKYNMFFLIAS